jgi:transcriptional regulator with XRE-family HTH domain
MKGGDLKQIMDRLGLTQQGLADQLSVARNTVNRWANDLEPIPDAIEIAVKSLKLTAKRGKTMPLDLRKRRPVVCPDCGQQLFAELSKKNPGQAVFGSCRCDRSVYNVPSGSIMFGHKDGLLFIYGPEND